MGERTAVLGKAKQNHVCVVDADESVRIRLEGVPHRYHEDHIAAKEINSLSHYNLVHKFIPMPQALKKNTRGEGCSGKRKKTGKIWKRYRHGKDWRAEKCTMRHWWTSVISRIRNWNLNFKKYKGRVVLRGDIVKDDSGSYSDESRKSHGYHIQTARMRRTSSWRSICLSSGQNGRCTDVVLKSKVRMSRYLDTSTKTQMAKIMVKYGWSRCSSWTESVRSPFGKTIVWTAIRESSIEIRTRKSSKLGMLIR